MTLHLRGPLDRSLAVVELTTTGPFYLKSDDLNAAALVVVPQGEAADGAASSGNPISFGGVYNTTRPTYDNGDRTTAQFDSRGNLAVTLWSGNSALAGLANNVDGVNALTIGLVANAYGYDFNGTSWDRRRKPNGASRIPSAAASVNATSAKASAGDLHVVSGHNASASVVYIKFYNKATAPTVGTDTPVLTLACKASEPFLFDLEGHYFSTGIAYGLTTDAADAGTTALSPGDVLGLTVTYA